MLLDDLIQEYKRQGFFKGSNIYVLSLSATIKLLLRRTPVRLHHCSAIGIRYFYSGLLLLWLSQGVIHRAETEKNAQPQMA